MINWRDRDFSSGPCSPLDAPRGVIIDACDLPLIYGMKWGHAFGGVRYVRSLNEPKVALHRYLMMCPDHLVVDHINGNVFDNRRANLRTCTRAQNMRNQRRNLRNTTGFKGVVKSGASYYAWIKAGSVKERHGPFSTAQQAHAAYCEAATRLHGEFARFA